MQPTILTTVLSMALAAPPEILPPPQQVQWHAGAFSLPRALDISAPPAWQTQVHQFRWIIEEGFKSRGDASALTIGAVATTSIEIRRDDGKAVPSSGYILEITPGGIRVQAAEPGGVFNALATLSQMIEQAEGDPPMLPACRIRDWPVLPLRVVHIDLTCQQYTAAYVQSLMRTLARYKVNAILMEYSDMFPFRRHKPICRPDAFSEKDVADILQTAAECNQEVIPFLQCLGHLEYVLHVPEYARYGASHSGYMYCPSSPATMPFVRELIDEILEQHPGIRRLHIGGDEVSFDRGGPCPTCEAYVQKHSFSDLYVHHYRQVADYCRSKDITPLMWSDMILQHPEAVSELPRNIAWVVWDYAVTTDPTPQASHGAILGRLDRVSPAYRQYFGKGIGLDDADRRGGLVAFGHAMGFKDLGFDAFTAPAARCSGDNFDWPRFDLHMRNLRIAFLKAAEFHLPGTIVTNWSYRGSSHELCLAEMSSVAYGWNDNTPDIEPLLTAFFRQRYGIDQPGLAQAVLGVSTVLPATTVALPKRDNARNAWVLSTELQLAQIKTLIQTPQREELLQQHRAWLDQVQHLAALWREATRKATRNRGDLRHWNLAISHIEHRLRLIQPLAGLAEVAYADAQASEEQVRKWQEELKSLEGSREDLRVAWADLYGPIATPQHLEVQLLERFDAEREIAAIVLHDVAVKPSLPASRH
jgi:hypothetical protein